jgi:hypothetical protein
VDEFAAEGFAEGGPRELVVRVRLAVTCFEGVGYFEQAWFREMISCCFRQWNKEPKYDLTYFAGRAMSALK